jgi:hypothetical protein
MGSHKKMPDDYLCKTKGERVAFEETTLVDGTPDVLLLELKQFRDHPFRQPL